MPDFPPTEEAPLSSVSEVDIFNGIKVRAKLLAPNLDAIAFGSLLEESLKVWTREERTGVWVFVPNPKSSLIPAALDQGFDFHHAKPGYAALIKWIGPGASMIPRQPFASVGVGAVIFNQREELLCVMEKNGPTAGRNMWKIPTGSADPGENIGRAAEREVWEETQIEAKFDKLLLFRQRYPDPKRNTDLYFVCSLKLEVSISLSSLSLPIDRSDSCLFFSFAPGLMEESGDPAEARDRHDRARGRQVDALQGVPLPALLEGKQRVQGPH